MTTLPSFDELTNIRTTLTEIITTESSSTETTTTTVDRKRLEDTIFELITMGYVYGVEVAGLSLNTDIPVNAGRMRDVAAKPTKGENYAKRIGNHIDEYERSGQDDTAVQRLIEQIAVVAETETHRTINEAILDGGEEYLKAHPSSQLYKTWVTAGDERVRDTHDYLEGSTVPFDARFYTYDGDSADGPGGFSMASNNVNCRCILELSE